MNPEPQQPADRPPHSVLRFRLRTFQIVVRSDQLEYARQLIEEKLDSVSESRL